ncbi:MAG: prepilin-type N-terminal cleavage/methylation domain-containing protein [Verrucomicrobiota bacterium]
MSASEKNRIEAFTLAEIVVGLFIFSIFAAGLLSGIRYYTAAVHEQYSTVRAIELADDIFKDFRSRDFTDLVFLFGLTSTSTGSSVETTIQTTTDGYSISGIATPDSIYGATADDSLIIKLTVNWSVLNKSMSREFQSTFLNRGVMQ